MNEENEISRENDLGFPPYGNIDRPILESTDEEEDTVHKNDHSIKQETAIAIVEGSNIDGSTKSIY